MSKVRDGREIEESDRGQERGHVRGGGGRGGRGERTVTLFWMEKAALIIESLQLSSVLWQRVEEIVPITWSAVARYYSIALVDLWFFFSFDYVAWLIVTWSLAAVILLGYLLLTSSVKAAKLSQALAKQARLRRFTVALCHTIYIPLALSWLRTFDCVAESQVWVVSLSIECWKGKHLVVVIFTAIIGAAFLVVFPCALCYLVSRELIFVRQADHDNYLVIKETEYLLEFDNYWATSNLPLVSPFKRRWAYFWPMSEAFSLVFVGSLVLIPSQVAAMLVVLVLVGLRVVAFVLKGPFRVPSSNFVAGLCTATLFVNIIFLFFVSTGIESPLLLASALSVWFIIINGTFFLVLFAAILFLVATTNKKYRWPVTLATVEEDGRLHEGEFVRVLEEGVAVERRARASRRGQLNPTDILLHCQRLEGSVRLAADSGDPLEWQLASQLEGLTALFYAKGPYHWDLLNHEPLQAMMKPFLIALSRRDIQLVLMSPLKKRLLLKMTAVATWVDIFERARAVRLPRRTLWGGAGAASQLLLSPLVHEDDSSDSSELST